MNGQNPLPNYRFCLGKCDRRTSHKKQLLESEDYLVTCEKCGREGIAIA